MKDEWEKPKSTSSWNPEKPGDELKGVVLGWKDGMFGTHYTIKKADDAEIQTPAHKALIGQMGRFDPPLKEGDYVRIVYIGEKPPKVRGENPMKEYEVTRRKA